jgi:hypothetical protein
MQGGFFPFFLSPLASFFQRIAKGFFKKPLATPLRKKGASRHLHESDIEPAGGAGSSPHPKIYQNIETNYLTRQ